MPLGHTGKIALTMQSPVYTEAGTKRNGSTHTQLPITAFIGKQAVARMPLKTAKSVGEVYRQSSYLSRYSLPNSTLR